MCVCVCTIGEGCLHLNRVHSHGLGGLVVFNVTIAGQNDLCGAGRHRGLNPPPPCLFQFSPSFTVKRGSDFFPSPFLLSSLPPISLNRPLTGQGMSWRSLNLGGWVQHRGKSGNIKCVWRGRRIGGRTSALKGLTDIKIVFNHINHRVAVDSFRLITIKSF